MLELSEVGFRSHGEQLRFRDHPAYRGRVRCRLSRVGFRVASTGEAPMYMHAPAGVRDCTGEIFPVYCYFDEETTRTLRQRRALVSGEYAVEIDGVLLHWILGVGVEMIESRLLSLESGEEPGRSSGT